MSPRSGIGLAAGSVNYVYVSIDLSSDDTINITTNTTATPPSNPSVQVATIDTSSDEVAKNYDVPESEWLSALVRMSVRLGEVLEIPAEYGHTVAGPYKIDGQIKVDGTLKVV